jgi:peptide/nickel transport system permease protein
MRSYILRRLLLLVPVLLGVSTLVFLFIHMIPGDPVELMLGESAMQADVERMRAALGLDMPLHVQYLKFMAGLFTGDLGTSFYFKEPVFDILRRRYPATLELAAAGMLVAVLIALPAGIISAVRKDSVFDGAAMLLSMIGVSIPNFWLGPLLILAFSIHLAILPVSGMEGPASLVLPALTLGLGMAAILSRITRSAVLEVAREEYVNTARAKGLSDGVVVWKHVLKNAMIPVITIIGLQFGALLSGAVITETVFSWPGVGRLLVNAIRARDYPLVQGCVLAISMSYVFINLATDLLYAAADPRVRYGK